MTGEREPKTCTLHKVFQSHCRPRICLPPTSAHIPLAQVELGMSPPYVSNTDSFTLRSGHKASTGSWYTSTVVVGARPQPGVKRAGSTAVQA